MCSDVDWEINLPHFRCTGTPGESPDAADVSAKTRCHRFTHAAHRYAVLRAVQDGSAAARLPGYRRRNCLRQPAGHDNAEMWLRVVPNPIGFEPEYSSTRVSTDPGDALRIAAFRRRLQLRRDCDSSAA